MGSIDNAYSPFNIFYEFTNETIVEGDKTFTPHNPTIVPCFEAVETLVSLKKS